MARNQKHNIATDQVFYLDVPSAAATLAVTAMLKSLYLIQILAINYNNPTGLAVNAANYFVGTATKTGAVAVATVFNTNSAGGAALVANTPVSAVMQADANCTLQPGDSLILTATLTGAQTLPAGRYEIHYRRV